MLLTTKHEFCMGHRLPFHEGKCKNVHGHNYQVEVTVEGPINKLEGNSSNGMVVDFSDLKGQIKTWINEKLDHAYMGMAEHDAEMLITLAEIGSKLCVVDFSPTAENISEYMFNELKGVFRLRFGSRAVLRSIKLWETSGSFVECLA